MTPLRVFRASSAFFVSLCLSAVAQDASILKAVDDHYNHLHTLRTRYTERYAGMGITRSETGTLLLKRPGQMRWQYDKPAGKLFVLDGKFAWFYTPGDAQAQRIPAKQLDDLRSPLRFLLGHTQLKKELDGLSVAPIPTGFRIAGVPKGIEDRVRQLTLDVTPTGEITAMKLEELDGTTTEFSFTDEHENVPTNEADFGFTPPPGVAIVNGTQPM